ncbi:MAG: hypothetical protein ACRCSP_06365, partial [Rhodoglobus sp.]
EDDLRALFATPSERQTTLNTQHIIATSRARRRPRQAAAAAVSVLAAAGLVVLGVQAWLPGTPNTMIAQQQASDSSGTSHEAGAPAGALDSPAKRASVEEVNRCAGPLATATPNASGLRLEVAFPPTAPVGTAAVPGTVTLTNTSATRVSGYASPAPTVILSQNGTVLWHSTQQEEQEPIAVDLAPGESREYDAAFTPARCEIEDDIAGFRETLPAVSPGNYELSAVIDFRAEPMATDDDSSISQKTPEMDLVTSPPSPIMIG